MNRTRPVLIIPRLDAAIMHRTNAKYIYIHVYETRNISRSPGESVQRSMDHSPSPSLVVVLLPPDFLLDKRVPRVVLRSKRGNFERQCSFFFFFEM